MVNDKGIPYKEYKCEKKKVNKTLLERGDYDDEFPEEYDAYFPEEHSVLKGIIFDTRDVNDMRRMGGAIPQWYNKCFILRHGIEKWETYYQGPAKDFSVGDIEGDRSHGLFRILVQFESEEVKKQIQDVNARKMLRNRIKTSSLQLKKDVKELKELMKN